VLYKVPLVLTPQPEGGFTVTSPVLPELMTEGETVQDALGNVSDAMEAVVEIYEDLNRQLPPGVCVASDEGPVWLEALVTTS
jgi:antitoxin HicB